MTISSDDMKMMESAAKVLRYARDPNVISVMTEIINRIVEGRMPPRPERKIRHRVYMREYMRRRRAAARSTKMPNVIDDESIMFLDE